MADEACEVFRSPGAEQISLGTSDRSRRTSLKSAQKHYGSGNIANVSNTIRLDRPNDLSGVCRGAMIVRCCERFGRYEFEATGIYADRIGL